MALKQLTDEQRTKAESIDIGQPILDGWLRIQRKALETTVAKYAAALDVALRDEKLDDCKNPLWEKWFSLDARLMYADSTLGMLRRERAHVLVCENHGIDGVSAEEWAAVLNGATSDVVTECYEALALRGILTGEGSTAWQRACEKCAGPMQIVADAARLWRAHRVSPLVSPTGSYADLKS
jgi:hypothetical protein